MSALVRRGFVFYGLVQGVGFRYRARHAAALYGCTGWVQNLPDGSVAMELQGPAEGIEQVLGAIEAGRFIRIERMETRSLSPVAEEREFRTRG